MHEKEYLSRSGWSCRCGTIHPFSMERCPCPSLEDIEKSFDEYTLYCFEKEDYLDRSFPELIKFYNSLWEKREKIIEMIKKFKEGK